MIVKAWFGDVQVRLDYIVKQRKQIGGFFGSDVMLVHAFSRKSTVYLVVKH